MIPAITTIDLPCKTAPDLFVTPDNQKPHTASYRRRVEAAKILCARCPDQVACGQLARDTNASGVWGGEDDVDRARATGHRPRRLRTTRTPASCGTEAGYKRHRRDGEETCQFCRDALAAVQRRREAARRPPVTCGTRSGYRRHRRDGEAACQPCLDANAAADRRLHTTGTTVAP